MPATGDQYDRMASCSIRPADKADLLNIQDDWLVGQCHLPVGVISQVPSTCRHSSGEVFFLLDSSAIKPALEFRSNSDDCAIYIMERNVSLAVARR